MIGIIMSWQRCTLLALCGGKFTDGFPSQRDTNVEVWCSFEVSLNKPLHEQFTCWWFEIPGLSCDMIVVTHYTALFVKNVLMIGASSWSHYYTQCIPSSENYHGTSFLTYSHLFGPFKNCFGWWSSLTLSISSLNRKSLSWPDIQRSHVCWIIITSSCFKGM